MDIVNYYVVIDYIIYVIEFIRLYNIYYRYNIDARTTGIINA